MALRLVTAAYERIKELMTNFNHDHFPTRQTETLSNEPLYSTL
jgi:hypothetical protein